MQKKVLPKSVTIPKTTYAKESVTKAAAVREETIVG